MVWKSGKSEFYAIYTIRYELLFAFCFVILSTYLFWFVGSYFYLFPNYFIYFHIFHLFSPMFIYFLFSSIFIYCHLYSSIFTYIHLYSSTYQSIYLSFFFSLCFFLLFFLSIYRSIYRSIYLSVYLSVCLSVYLIISKSETSMKPTSNLHVSSMEPPSKLHQLDYMREPTNKCRYRGLQNLNETYINPPCILHGTSIKTPSVTLHERTSKCWYRGLQNLHETYIKPPCILHGTAIKPASAGTHHMRKMFKRYWCKSMSNRSQTDRKLIVKYALKNVIACVHFDVVFSGQSPLIDVTFGFCSGKFKLLQNYHLV